jgi:hypothetical protein
MTDSRSDPYVDIIVTDQRGAVPLDEATLDEIIDAQRSVIGRVAVPVAGLLRLHMARARREQQALALSDFTYDAGRPN